jgi:hypothetical protein
MFATSKETELVEIEPFLDFLIASYQLATVAEDNGIGPVDAHLVSLGMGQDVEFHGKVYFEAVVKSCVSLKNLKWRLIQFVTFL